ncbi:MAG: ABC transporter permease [Nitrososphaerota archaeon]
MKRYVIRRLLALIPVLLIVGLIGFLILNLIPGDPALVILGPEATLDQVAKLRKELGLDMPIYIRLFYWYLKLFRLDLGNSIFLSRPVIKAIFERLQPTILLSLISLIIASVIGVTTGIFAALKRGTWIDTFFTSLSVLGLSIPSFWLSLIMIIIFGVWLKWFPVAGYVPIKEGLLNSLKTLILPSLVLGFVSSAFISRVTRSSMLDVLNQDYIKVAHAKGLKKKDVIIKHALRNAILPIITVMGLTLGNLMSGAVIVETVFAIPGVGQLVLSSIQRRDYPLTQGILLFTATIFVLINLLVDIFYALLDPRIRYD